MICLFQNPPRAGNIILCIIQHKCRGVFLMNMKRRQVLKAKVLLLFLFGFVFCCLYLNLSEPGKNPWNIPKSCSVLAGSINPVQVQAPPLVAHSTSDFLLSQVMTMSQWQMGHMEVNVAGQNSSKVHPHCRTACPTECLNTWYACEVSPEKSSWMASNYFKKPSG